MRRSAKVQVANVDPQRILRDFAVSKSGSCRGDSGGPALKGTPGNETVVGITSYGVEDCRGEAVSVRVSAYLSFINPLLANPPPKETCSTCQDAQTSGHNTCAAKQRECTTDVDCKALVECENKCSTEACITACEDKTPAGIVKLEAARNCTCSADTCGEVCSNACKSVPKCGFKLAADECGTCSEGSCCTEIQECSADTDCFLCLRAGAEQSEACKTNPLRKAVADCSASKCKTECASSAIGAGGEPQAAAAAPTTTTTTECGCQTVGAPAPGAFGLLAGMGALATVVARRRRRTAE